jgi:hypothetical protein
VAVSFVLRGRQMTKDRDTTARHKEKIVAIVTIMISPFLIACWGVING